MSFKNFLKSFFMSLKSVNIKSKFWFNVSRNRENFVYILICDSTNFRKIQFFSQNVKLKLFAKIRKQKCSQPPSTRVRNNVHRGTTTGVAGCGNSCSRSPIRKKGGLGFPPSSGCWTVSWDFLSLLISHCWWLTWLFFFSSDCILILTVLFNT